ncbi:MAG: serine/threonine-protein phosphatase [Chitinophagaceae bacterium]|nr:serine/threonine-protein phosphatase [Chitinophagaceae bacterium]
MTLTNIYYLHEIGSKKTQEDYIWPVAGAATAEDKIFIVCDGVGGSENGEIASRIIAEYVGTALLKNKEQEISVPLINRFLQEGINQLAEYAEKHTMSTDMATTFSLLALYDNKAFIAWCGDTRVYHIRDGEVLYKTADHSLVGTLVKSGELTEEEALLHPQKNVILRAVKLEEAPAEAEGHIVKDLKDGDYFMLCTDGLLENITDKDLRFLLTHNENGTIDLVKSFQQFCYNKTKDNYSMYLLQTSIGSKRLTSGANRNMAILLSSLIAVSLAGISALYIRNMNATSKQQVLPAAVMLDSAGPAERDPAYPDSKGAFAAEKDTMPYVEVIKEAGSNRNERVLSAPFIKEIKDSVKLPKKMKRPKDSLRTVVSSPVRPDSPVLKTDTSTLNNY